MHDQPTTNSMSEDALSAPSSDRLQRSLRGGARAIAWGQLVSQITALLVLGLLYRRLPAEVFGLLGMAAPLLALAEMLSAFGLHVAAIQRHEIRHRELNALFWWNVALSAAASILIAASAAPLAGLYSEPRLMMFCLALAGLPLLSSLTRIHRALLERQMRFARLTVARFAAQLAAGAAAVAVAYRGWGAWSLLAQLYVDQLVFAVLLWSLHDWRPSAPNRGREHAELFRFSGLYAVSSLLFYVAQQADKILLSVLLGGMRGGTQMMGFYSQAHGLMARPLHQICTPITSLMLPSLSRAAAVDRPRLCEDFFRLVGILLFPAGAGLTVVASEVMVAMGGEDWRDAGRLLQCLAPILMVHGLISICGSVYASIGRTDRLCQAAAALVAALLLGAGCGAWLGYAATPTTMGLARGVAIGLSASFLLLAGPYVAACLRVAEVSTARVARALAPSAAAALLMAAGVAIANHLLTEALWPAPLRLGILIPLGVGVYAVLAAGELRWVVRRWMANDPGHPLTN